jgi:hypothetical protein
MALTTAVGYDTPSGATSARTLTLNWNGTARTTVASPGNGGPSLLNSAAAESRHAPFRKNS